MSVKCYEDKIVEEYEDYCANKDDLSDYFDDNGEEDVANEHCGAAERLKEARDRHKTKEDTQDEKKSRFGKALAAISAIGLGIAAVILIYKKHKGRR